MLYRLLKPFANTYTIIIAWVLTILNFYACFKPIADYATAAGLAESPTILDAMTYYTPDEGYHALTKLGPGGRDAYRVTNYADFVLPVLLFLALALPNVAMGKSGGHLLGAFLYMIADYVENLAEKYVLEIYPQRNDAVMTVACYAGLAKLLFCGVGLVSIAVNGAQRMSGARPSRKKVK